MASSEQSKLVYADINGVMYKDVEFYGRDCVQKAERYVKLLNLLNTMAEALRSENQRDRQAALNEYYRIMGN